MKKITLTIDPVLGQVPKGALEQAAKDLEFINMRSHPEHPLGPIYPYCWHCLIEIYCAENRIGERRAGFVSVYDTPLVEGFYQTVSSYNGEATHYVLSQCIRESNDGEELWSNIGGYYSE